MKDSSVDVRSPGKKAHKRHSFNRSKYLRWLAKDNNMTAQQLLSKIVERRKEETNKYKKKKNTKKNKNEIKINMKYVFNKELLPSLTQVRFIYLYIFLID